MGARDSSKAHELRKRLAGTAWVAQEHELWFGRNSFLFRENGDLIATWPWGQECHGRWDVREVSGHAQLFFIFGNKDDNRPHSVLMHNNGEMTIIHDLASKTYESIHPSDFKNAEVDSKIADVAVTPYRTEG